VIIIDFNPFENNLDYRDEHIWNMRMRERDGYRDRNALSRFLAPSIRPNYLKKQQQQNQTKTTDHNNKH